MPHLLTFMAEALLLAGCATMFWRHGTPAASVAATRVIVLLMLATVALLLGGCAPMQARRALVAPIAAVRTVAPVDDRRLLAVEVAYREAGALLDAAIDAGRLRGGAAVRADAIDGNAAHFVARARQACDAGDAEGCTASIDTAWPMIAELRALSEPPR